MEGSAKLATGSAAALAPWAWTRDATGPEVIKSKIERAGEEILLRALIIILIACSLY
jgi:hypothetical protein